MFIVNDIETLLALIKVFKVHERLREGWLNVSGIKTLQYGAITTQQLGHYPVISTLAINEPHEFESWRNRRDRGLSSGDWSTIYIAVKNPRLTVLISEEDHQLPPVCRECEVDFKHWDEVIAEILDDTMLEFYKLLKESRHDIRKKKVDERGW